MESHTEAVRRLMTAINKLDGAYYQCARRIGIKVNALTLLYVLQDGKPHSQKQICEEWLIPKTTINTIVRELENSGHLVMRAEPHTREKFLHLTALGRDYADHVLREILEAENRAISETLAQYSPAFIDALDCFADSLCTAFRLGEQNTNRKNE